MQLSQLDISAGSTLRSSKNNTGIWLLYPFVVLTLTLAIAGAGGVARAVFLVGAGLLALIFCNRSPPLYISFVLWLWFLTPFVRRLVNYRSGWLASDPILAASLLASLACLPKVCRSFFAQGREGALPFVLAFFAVAYGCCVGVFVTPPGPLLIAAANWTIPVLFGLFVFLEYANTENRGAITEAFESSFTWGLLLMGAYAVVQFTVLPAWDAKWLIEAANSSFGTAEPFGVRVFSTMASPLPLGVASFAGLILLMRQRGTISFFATVAGYASLALCLVRSTWGLWALGTAIILLRRGKILGRFILAIGLVSILLSLAMTLEPVRNALQKRFETLSDMGSDASFQARKNGYEVMSDNVLSDPLGSGLATMETTLKGASDLGTRDSGILTILLSLGWAGAAVYLSALGLVVWSAIKGSSTRTTFEMSAVAICIAMMAHMVLADITSDFSAVILWSFAGITVASNVRQQPRAARG